MSKSNLSNLKTGDAQSDDFETVQQVLAGDGAITIPDRGRKLVFLTEAGVSAVIVAAPTATTHDGVEIVVVSTTAQAHTVTATTIGFNAGNAASDVGTFGGAIGDGFSFVAYQGEWYVLTNTNVTLA